MQLYGSYANLMVRAWDAYPEPEATAGYPEPEATAGTLQWIAMAPVSCKEEGVREYTSVRLKKEAKSVTAHAMFQHII